MEFMLIVKKKLDLNEAEQFLTSRLSVMENQFTTNDFEGTLLQIIKKSKRGVGNDIFEVVGVSFSFFLFFFFFVSFI